VAALWEGVDTGSVELPIEKQRNKWRQRNKYGGNSKRFKRDQQPSGSGQSTKVGSNKNSSVKNKKPKQFVPPEKFLPRRLLAANYDEEKLFSTQLDAENLDEEQLVQQMVAALGEKEPVCLSLDLRVDIHPIPLQSRTLSARWSASRESKQPWNCSRNARKWRKRAE
jgi:hypothetical protein